MMIPELLQLADKLGEDALGGVGRDRRIHDEVDVVQREYGFGLRAVGGRAVGGRAFDDDDAVVGTAGLAGRSGRGSPGYRIVLRDRAGICRGRRDVIIDDLDAAVVAVGALGGGGDASTDGWWLAGGLLEAGGWWSAGGLLEAGGLWSAGFQEAGGGVGTLPGEPLIVGECSGLIGIAGDQDEVG